MISEIQLKLWEVTYCSYVGTERTDYCALVLAETNGEALGSVAGSTPRLKVAAREVKGPFSNSQVLITKILT